MLNKNTIVKKCMAAGVVCIIGIMQIIPTQALPKSENIIAVTATVTTAPAPMGDVNFDGKIDTIDANLALKAALGTIELSDAAIRAADINGNGKVDLDYANAILKMALNIK